MDAKPMLDELSLQRQLLGDRAAEFAGIIAEQRLTIAQRDARIKELTAALGLRAETEKEAPP